MNQKAMLEVSDILDTFNIQELSTMINKQINVDYENEDNSTEILLNHFKPLYIKYIKIMNNELVNQELKTEAETRFMEICEIFLTVICKKFNISIDSEWKDNNYKNMPGITLMLYSFFVLDFKSNLYDVISNYINKNHNMIYHTFEDLKTKKDASSIVNRKFVSPELAVIVSNIHNISSWILNQMTEEEFFIYINEDYLPLKLIIKLYDDAHITGEFMEAINEIFNASINLKSNICFQFISGIRTNTITDPFIEDSKNKNEKA